MESCLLPLHRPLTASLGSTAPTATASDRGAEPKGSAFTRTLRRRQIQPRWCSKIILGTHRTKNHSEPASTLMASEVGWTMSPTRSPTPAPPSTAFLASSLTDAGTPCESPASQSHLLPSLRGLMPSLTLLRARCGVCDPDPPIRARHSLIGGHVISLANESKPWDFC